MAQMTRTTTDDELGPVDSVMRGWDVTMALMRKDMADMRMWRALIRKLRRVVPEMGRESGESEEVRTGSTGVVTKGQ